MKINLFSPVPPARSAVALQTAAALPALARAAEIVLWVDEAASDPSLESDAEVRRYDPSAMPWTEVNAADATIYHLANDARGYTSIWQVYRHHPGIVVLHDINMQNFFSGLVTQTEAISADEYLAMIAFHHPATGRKCGEALLNGLDPEDECRMTGAALENAAGVAVHSTTAYKQLSHVTDMPVAYVPPFGPAEMTAASTGTRGGEPHTIEAYANGLIALAKATKEYEAGEAARFVAGRAGEMMKPWYSDGDTVVLLPRLSRVIGELFASGPAIR